MASASRARVWMVSRNVQPFTVTCREIVLVRTLDTAVQAVQVRTQGWKMKGCWGEGKKTRMRMWWGEW